MKKFLILVSVFIVAGVVWWLASPLFLNTTVEEEFPTLEELERMTPEEKVAIRDNMMEHAAQMPPTVVNENMPVQEGGTLLPVEGTTEGSEAPEQSEPTLLKQGIFRDADAFHRGSGTVGIYTLADKSTIARFENFSVTNGPDLRVLLATGADPTNSDSLGEYIELGKLKGNQGSQNYTVPESIDVSSYKSVVIYCKPFHVVFATAKLN